MHLYTPENDSVPPYAPTYRMFRSESYAILFMSWSRTGPPRLYQSTDASAGTGARMSATVAAIPEINETRVLHLGDTAITPT